MNSTKLAKKEGISNTYSNLVNEMAKNDNRMKAFLPFIKKYSFFNAYRSLSNVFRSYICDSESMKNTIHLYETYLLIDESLNIHSILSSWNTKDRYSLDSCFDNLLTGSANTSLLCCKNIDRLIKQMSITETEFIGIDLAVLTEYRNAFLRFHCIENDIDLSEYIDN